MHSIDRDSHWLILWQIVMLLFLRPWNHVEKDYVYIKNADDKPDDHCASPVGMKAGQNVMVLNRNCFDYHPIMHQFFHILGFAHENQRPDSYKYITSQ